MDLRNISQDSATAHPQNPREPPNVSSDPPLQHGILQDHPFHQKGMDKNVVLKNLEEEECRDLDSKYISNID